MGLNGDEKFSAKLVLHRGGSVRDICSSDLLLLKDRVCWDLVPQKHKGSRIWGAHLRVKPGCAEQLQRSW